MTSVVWLGQLQSVALVLVLVLVSPAALVAVFSTDGCLSVVTRAITLCTMIVRRIVPRYILSRLVDPTSPGYSHTFGVPYISLVVSPIGQNIRPCLRAAHETWLYDSAIDVSLLYVFLFLIVIITLCIH